MPGINVYCRAKAVKFREQLWETYDRTGDNDFLVIYPTSARTRAARLNQARRFGALTGEIILSLQELKEHLAAGVDRRFVSTQELPLLLHFAWQDPALRADLLSYLREDLESSRQNTTAGESLTDQLQLSHGILNRLAEELEVLSQTPDSERPDVGKELSDASELHSFATKFFQHLEQKGWFYREKLLVRIWEEGNPWLALPNGEKLRDVVLDGFWVFPPFVWALLRWFRDQSRQRPDMAYKSPTLHLLLDFSPHSESERFPHLAELWDELKRWAGGCAHQQLSAKKEPGDSSDWVRHFCDEADCHCEERAEVRPIIIRAADREEEVRHLAKQLREMAEKDRSFQGYAVCVTSFPDYLGLIRSAFREEGIPYRVPFAHPLTLTPIWDFFERLAEVVRGSSTISSETGPLNIKVSLRLAELDRLATHPWITTLLPINCWRFSWYRWARGRFATAGTLDDLLFSIERELGSPQGSWSEEENGIVEKTNILQQLADQLHQLNGELRGFLPKLEHDEWSEKIDSLLHKTLVKLAVRARNVDLAGRVPLGRTADDARFVTASIARLLSLVRRYKQLWRELGFAGALTFQDYLNGLALLAETELVADRVVNELGVQILAPTEAVGERFTRLFLVGMTEGQFPTLESKRTIAERLSGGLRPEVRALSEQRYAFMQLIQKSETVYISYPRVSQDIELLPSQFLEEFEEPQSVAPLRSPVIELASKLNSVPESALSLRNSGSKENILGKPARQCLAQLAWIKSVAERRRAPFFTELEGNLDGSILAARVEDATLNRVFSAHQLQNLVNCRLNFFFNHVLRIQSPQDEDVVYAIERGQLVHLILREVLSRVIDSGWVPLGDYRDAIMRELVRITWRELLDKFRDEPLQQVAFAIEFLGGLAFGNHSQISQQSDKSEWLVHEALRIQPSLASAKGLLVEFVEYEILRAQEQVKSGEPGDWKPAFLEWRFGQRGFSGGDCDTESAPGKPTDGWESSIEISLPMVSGAPNSIALRGAIDRVDVGSLDHTRVFGVIDYKTGSSHPNSKDIATRFCAVQLPLYAEALRVVSSQLEETAYAIGECAMLGYYQISRAATKLVAVQEPKTDIASVIENTLRRIAVDLAGCAKGQFHPLGASAHEEEENKAKCQSPWWRCPYYLLCCRGKEDELLVKKVSNLCKASSG